MQELLCRLGIISREKEQMMFQVGTLHQTVEVFRSETSPFLQKKTINATWQPAGDYAAEVYD